MNPIHNHTETSIEAAEFIKPFRESCRDKVLRAIKESGERGLTREEIEAKTGLSGNTVRPRVSELFKMKKIKQSYQYGKTASGLKAEIVVAV